MFGSRMNPASAYAELGRESDVNTASPHRLIVLLFEGAESAINVARVHAERGDIASRGSSISKAIDIISNGLKVSLDVTQGGELALRLSALYDYMVSRLLWANMKNDTQALQEVLSLLGEIHEAWNQITPEKQQQ
ncbi:flagellar protein FliS [Betaproteobacteria bacterium]|nr:flagellar protein FliS [Betaproteobacteria bacterium]GHT98154.1 flagellar protein FliS [Betaproteobacteria bacterium]GHU08706.1 flagellar protein FliS [Betaproteobacteria bacterium]GHU27096.1 flagellar protein FliS [Betaproteobacteria bacterium]